MLSPEMNSAFNIFDSNSDISSHVLGSNLQPEPSSMMGENKGRSPLMLPRQNNLNSNSLERTIITGRNKTIRGTSGNDILDASRGKGKNRLIGRGGNDRLFGRKSDILIGGSGNDRLDVSKGRGRNKLRGGSGNDRLFARRRDQLVGGAGNDILDASDGKGRNRLNGGKGNDVLVAGKSDRLIGGTGDDIIWAQGSARTVTGGEGEDTFLFSLGSSATVTDFDASVDSISIVDSSGIFESEALVLAQDGDNAVVTLEGETVATLEGVNAEDLNDQEFSIVQAEDETLGAENVRKQLDQNSGTREFEQGSKLDPVGLGTVKISSVRPSDVFEDGNQSFEFVFIRSRKNQLFTQKFDFEIGGTATFGQDYTVSGATVSDDGEKGTLTFEGSSANTIVTVTPIDDNLEEADEAVVLSFFVRSADTGSRIIGKEAKQGIIKDSTQTVSVPVNPVLSSIPEDSSSGMVYKFTRQGSLEQPLTVDFGVGGTATYLEDYTQSGASNFSDSRGSVTFAAGAREAKITLKPKDDKTDEPNETIELNLIDSDKYKLGTNTKIEGRILDNGDEPPTEDDDESPDKKPLAVEDVFNIEEDQSVRGNVLDNDDPGDQPTQVTAHDQTTAYGVPVVLDPNGGFTYTPPANRSGQDFFTYTITDSDGDTSTTTVRININANPDAVKDVFNTEEDQPVSGNVLDNDDLGDQPTQVTAYDRVTSRGGFVDLNANGVFTYTPPANQSGQDFFTYTITDVGGDTSTTTVQININPGSRENRAPVANDFSLTTISEGMPLAISFSTLLAQTSDADNDSLSITGINPSNPGAGNLIFDPTNQRVVFQPNPFFITKDINGNPFTNPYAFEYTVSDGNLADNSTVSFHVQDREPKRVLAKEEGTENPFAGATVLGRDVFGVSPNTDLQNGANGSLPHLAVEGGLGRADGRAEVDIVKLDLFAGETLTLDLDYGARSRFRTNGSNEDEKLNTHLYIFGENINTTGIELLVTPDVRNTESNRNKFYVPGGRYVAGAMDSGVEDPGSARTTDPLVAFTAPKTASYYVAIATEDTVWRENPAGTPEFGFFDRVDLDRSFRGDYLLYASLTNISPVVV